MSIKNWPGGFIQPIPPTPTGPFQDGRATGVWTLDQVAYWLQQGLWPIAGNLNARALFAGGQGGRNVIQYVQIGTLGNATDFGDLTVGREDLSACASSTRAVFSGGSNQVPENTAPLMDYVTIATTGDAVSFGTLNNTPGQYESCGFNSSTRGIFSGGRSTNTVPVNAIYRITIASTGDAVSFGGLTVARRLVGGCSSPTRGVTAGGLASSSESNVIDFVTIASAGNATDFGDLTLERWQLSGASSATRGLFLGGFAVSNRLNTIDYVTIASAGNAIDFGDLLTPSGQGAAASSSTRVIIALGLNNAGTQLNTIEYVTIATTGNALDFGDLLSINSKLAAASNGNGGVQ